MAHRSSKRQKVSNLSNSLATSPKTDIHEVFTQWSISRGVEIRGVAPVRLSGRGVGLMTTKHIKKDTRVLFVPEKAMFKPDLKLLESKLIHQASPQAQLAISAINQCQKDPSGRPPLLAAWEATWPTNQDLENSMPMCWPQELLDHLPQSVHQPLERLLQDYHRDWTSVQAYCESRGWSEKDFRYYWMIVNSRSFHWKPYPSSASASKRTKHNPGGAGSMVMCPFIDYMNHAPTGTSVNVYQRRDGYEVMADKDYPPGTELLATYGPHPNDKLLVHYGFIVSPYSSDDDIRLDPIILPLIPAETQSQLRDVGFLGSYALLPGNTTVPSTVNDTNSSDNNDNDTTDSTTNNKNHHGGSSSSSSNKIRGDGELCFKTQVAARAVLQSCNEWEYFLGNGEDLGEEFGGKVKEWVGRALRRYLTDVVEREIEALDAIAAKEGPEEQTNVAVEILRMRWRQIRDAVQRFLGSR